MKLEIELDDRQFNDIEGYCKANNLDVQSYLIDIISEKHSINKFGDLNDLIPKVIEEEKVEVKKRGRPKKVKEVIEEPIKTQSIDEISDNTSDNISSEGDKLTTVVTIPNEVEEVRKEETPIVKPTVKRKRTLKAL